jgi:hypothetical protein
MSSADSQEVVETLDDDIDPNAKPKRWSWSPCEAYFMNIMIRACCEIIEISPTMSLSGIQVEVMEKWHLRYHLFLLVDELSSSA